jgi:hypothetical protein
VRRFAIVLILRGSTDDSHPSMTTTQCYGF